MSRTAAILLAAGSSRRMAGAVPDKVLAPLAGKPAFAHTAATFVRSGVIDFFVVTYRDQQQMVELSAYAPTPTIFVRGGVERQHSVAAALAELPDDVSHVFIHDCARPLVRVEQLVALHKIVRREDAVVLARRVTDTIKEHRGEGRLRTLDRRHLWAMETPQVFSTRPSKADVQPSSSIPRAASTTGKTPPVPTWKNSSFPWEEREQSGRARMLPWLATGTR